MDSKPGQKWSAILVHNHCIAGETLLSAIPVPDPKVGKERQRIKMQGEIGSPINTTPGCRFASRCRMATEQCLHENPVFKEVEKDHFVACHLFK